MAILVVFNDNASVVQTSTMAVMELTVQILGGSIQPFLRQHFASVVVVASQSDVVQLIFPKI